MYTNDGNEEYVFRIYFSGKTGCKRPVSIVYRNRSTEALAHSMTELAKSVLFRSGGHLASSFYVRDSETGSVKTPNHVLHMCALQLAMYGLGISNNASSSWESRSYSLHVAMLTSKTQMSVDAPPCTFSFYDVTNLFLTYIYSFAKFRFSHRYRRARFDVHYWKLAGPSDSFRSEQPCGQRFQIWESCCCKLGREVGP